MEPRLAANPSWLLARAETRWAVIRDALYNPEEWDDQRWQSEVLELPVLYSLLKRIKPTTEEEKARLKRLYKEINQAAKEFGFRAPKPPPDSPVGE